MNRINLSDINVNDIADNDFYRVSRKIYNETLPYSLKNSGMLEYPYIVKNGDNFTVFTCHNRIKILCESGIGSLRCILLDLPESDIFIRHFTLKAYRNEIGPAGKLKIIKLLSEHFNLPQQSIRDIAARVLKIPAELSGNESFYNRVLSFPGALLDYVDDRDINFRVVKDLSLLPDEWLAVISRWLDTVPVRVNIFRPVVDLLFDIFRRGDSVVSVESAIFTDDRSLYNAVFNVRYPDYSVLKARSEKLIDELNGSGLTVEFPEYFDRGSINVRLEVNKKGPASDQLKRISRIDAGKLDELLSML